MSWKWFIPLAVLAASMLYGSAFANAKYYPLECSNEYSGYCNEGGDCFSQFGDGGVNYNDFCFDVPNNPHIYTDELTGLGDVTDKLDMIISGNIFLYKIVGFWLPFSVILNFCMTILLTILFKFGYFRKN